MKQSSKRWTALFLALLLAFLSLCAAVTVVVDPYFHYHKPLKELYYELHNQRSQNNGIVKHFAYDALITGSSMTENFRTSELDELFGVHSVKVSYSGATFKEIHDNLEVALKNHPGLRLVVRSLDNYGIGMDSQAMRTDMGEYPTYLYDDTILNDAPYVLNKSILLELAWPMVSGYLGGMAGGITDFDQYSRWAEEGSYGKSHVLPVQRFSEPREQDALSAEDKQRIRENLEQNVISLAREYPETEFYSFFPPYSIVWWGEAFQRGELQKRLEEERYAIELLVAYDNIHLFSFNDVFEITTNLDNYKDAGHYGDWINSYILQQMQQGKGRITRENYLEYLNREWDFYMNFNYNSLFDEES